MTTIESLEAWMRRKHKRCCEREAGTFGPDDLGCRAGCTCPAEISDATVANCRRLAAVCHAKFRHAGSPEVCEDPHDVLCRAVWPK